MTCIWSWEAPPGGDSSGSDREYHIDVIPGLTGDLHFRIVLPNYGNGKGETEDAGYFCEIPA